MPDSGSYRVLLIDDDVNLHELVNDAFETAGFKLFSAFDGEMGIEKIHDVAPDVV